MTPRDKEFLETIIKGAAAKGIKPPFEMTISVFNSLVRKFYEYGTDKSTKGKMMSLVSEGLFETTGSGFRITATGERIGSEK